MPAFVIPNTNAQINKGITFVLAARIMKETRLKTDIVRMEKMVLLLLKIRPIKKPEIKAPIA